MINNALKTISETPEELTVANYIVLFDGRDLEWLRRGANPDGSLGEYFSKGVELESSYTQAGVLHLDWEHGNGKGLDGDDSPGEDDVLGYVDWKTARKDERGWWVERVLSRRNKYMRFLEDLVRAGMLGTSSEPVQGKVVKGQDGGIRVWPLKRDTLTVSPAEPRMMTENVVVALKSLSGLLTVPPQSAGVPTLAQKAQAVAADLQKLLNEVAALGNGERPLSNTKRLELKKLLEMFSELDAVRPNLESLLKTAPRAGVRRTLYELGERRKRLARILQE